VIFSHNFIKIQHVHNTVSIEP